MKGKHNVKKSKTLKPPKMSLQKKSNYSKNQEKSNFRFTDKNYNIILEIKPIVNVVIGSVSRIL